MIGTKGVGKVPGGNGGKFQERESASWEGAAHQRGNDMASSGGTDPPISITHKRAIPAWAYIGDTGHGLWMRNIPTKKPEGLTNHYPKANLCLPPKLLSPPSPLCLFCVIKRSVAYRWLTDEQPFQLVINIFLVGTSFLLIITLLQCFEPQTAAQ